MTRKKENHFVAAKKAKTQNRYRICAQNNKNVFLLLLIDTMFLKHLCIMLERDTILQYN